MTYLFIRRSCVALFALLLPAILFGASLDNRSNWYPFVFPSQNNASSPVDLSYLNDGPAGANGFIRAKDGHFVDGKGERIRLFGTNVSFSTGTMPDKQLAATLAKHLRRLGFNAVRIFVMGPQPTSESDPTLMMDPQRLDQQDYFLAELKKNGMYVHVNPVVHRNYGTPNGMLAARAGKYIDYFYEPVMKVQQEYIQLLVTHKNPYTGLSMAEDPGILCIEPDNENSLFRYSFQQYANLPSPYRDNLLEKWHKFLMKRYASDDELRRHWQADLHPQGKQLLKNANWDKGMENWTVIQADNLTSTISDSSTSRTLVLQKSSGEPITLAQDDLQMEDGKPYTLRFIARSDNPSSMTVSFSWVTIEGAAKTSLQTYQVYKDWRIEEMTFLAANPENSRGRMTFSVAPGVGQVELTNISLYEGNSPSSLQYVNSVSRNTADLPRLTTRKNETNDYRLFLLETEINAMKNWRTFLKDECHFQPLMVYSQANYGGIASLYRESSVTDYIDVHAYWQHPMNGKNRSNWRIGNSPLAGAADGGTMSLLSSMRLLDRPFTVSEYNHPFPSFYSAEMFPIWSSIGSVQDWDGIFQFCYRNHGDSWSSDHVENHFTMDGHPVQLSMLPFASLVFRTGAFTTDAQPAQLRVPTNPEKGFASAGVTPLTRLWQDAGLPPLAIASTPIGVKFANVEKVELIKAENNLPPQISWTTGEKPIYRAESNRAAALTGAIADGQEHAVGPFTIKIDATSNGFATFSAVALDQKPFEQSNNILIALANRVENSGMIWNATHTSVGVNWGTAPTIVEPVTGSIKAKLENAEFYRLDETGKISDQAKSNKANEFTVGSDKTLWYLIQKK